MTENPTTPSEMQLLIEHMYGSQDEARGVSGTLMWLMEDIGELAAELREQQPGAEPSENLGKEFADVLAWLVTIANVAGVDLTAAFHAKYGTGCPGCGRMICQCANSEKP